MTNAEYYLKEGINKEELYEKIPLIFYDGYSDNDVQRVKNFFEEKHVTLTEDERVILRYVDNRYTHIERNDGLFLIDYETEHLPIQLSFEMYSHLFQFIKERRRILY